MNSAIRNRRIAAGYTQSALAEKVGVRQNAVAQWESGATSPRVATLPKLAEALNCTVDDLLCGKND